MSMYFSKTPQTTVGIWRDDFKLRPNSKGRPGSYHFLRIKIWKPTGAYQMVSSVNYSTIRVNVAQTCIIVSRVYMFPTFAFYISYFI